MPPVHWTLHLHWARPGSAAEGPVWQGVASRKLALSEHRLRLTTHRLEPLTAAATNHDGSVRKTWPNSYYIRGSSLNAVWRELSTLTTGQPVVQGKAGRRNSRALLWGFIYTDSSVCFLTLCPSECLINSACRLCPSSLLGHKTRI